MDNKKLIGIFAFGVAGLLLVGFCLLLILPGETVNRMVGDEQLYAQSSRAWLMFPWECYDIIWSFEGAQQVLLDGWGVRPIDSVPVCLEWRSAPQFETYHIFNIVTADGTSTDIPFTQRAFIGRVEFWGGLLLFAVLIFIADRLGIVPWRSVWLRKKLSFLIPPVPSIPESPLTRVERWFVVLMLAVIIAAGLAMRVSMIYRLGESNYQAWSMRYYYGGLTDGYIGLADPELAPLFANVYPPGYPFMISTLGKLGLDLTGIRIVQAVLDVLAVIAIYLTLRRMKCSLWIAILGGTIYALYPTWAGASIVVLGEWVMPSAMAWIAYLLLLAANKIAYRWWTLAGAAISLMLTFRPEGLLVIGLAGLWLLWQCWAWKRTILAGIALLLGFGIFTTIVGLKNLSERGVFTVSSSAGGYALWSGLGMLPNDYGYFRSDRLAGERIISLGLTWNTPEANQYWMNEYLNAWRERPGYVISSIALRFYQILSAQDYYLVDFVNLPHLDGLISWTDFWKTWGFFIVVGGGVISLRDKRRLFLLLFPLCAALITNGIVYYESRYVHYASISYLIGSVFLLDWVYTYILKFAYPKIQQIKPERVSLVLAVPIVLFMGVFAFVQAPPLLQMVRDARAADRERMAFTPENRTPLYHMQELAWVPAPNLQGDANQGWQVTTVSENPWATSLWTPIPIDQVSIILVQMHVELVRGSGYLSLSDASGHETDQQLIKISGEYDITLVANVSGQSTMYINALTFALDSLMIIESVEVYTVP